MIDPDKMLQLTMLNAQNTENVLEIDPELIIGWMGFPEASIIYINGPKDHSHFSVQENIETIKEKLRGLRKIND